MSEHVFEVESGKAIKMPTKGKVCTEDIIVRGVGGSGGSNGVLLDEFWDGVISDLTINANTIPAYGCYKATQKKIIVNNATAISNYCFQYAQAEEIIINSNLVKSGMGNCAFQGCSNLMKVSFLDTITLNDTTSQTLRVFDECSVLKEVDIPNLMKVGELWFKDCVALEKLDIQGRYIGTNAFLRSSISTLVLRYDGISTLSNINALSGTPIEAGTGYIYVPKALLSDDDATKDYRRATNWVTFANQFRAIEDYPEICGGAE